MIQSKSAYGIDAGKKEISVKKLFSPYIGNFLIGIIWLFLTNAIAISLPRIVNKAVMFIEKGEGFELTISNMNLVVNKFSYIIGILVLFTLIGSVIRTLSRIQLFNIGRFIERDLRKKLFDHLIIQDKKFFTSHQIGELMSHLTIDITNVRLLLGFGILNFANIIFVFFMTVPILFQINFLMAAVALLPFPLVMITTQGLSKKMFKYTKTYQEELGQLNNEIRENLLGSHIIRLFHKQHLAIEKFKISNEKTFKQGLSLAKTRLFLFPVMRLVMGLSVVLVLFVGVKLLLDNKISLGDFVEINSRILQLTWPVMSVGFIISMYHRAKASITRVNVILNKTPNITDGDLNIDSIDKIDFKNFILNKSKISLSFKKPETIAIVGPSGSYKTMALLALYRGKSVLPGTLFVNEHDINAIDLRSYNSKIAVVTEEPFLFHASILENVMLGSQDSSKEEVLDALKMANVYEDVKKFKEGIYTIVGERGVTLSGGQRQRVALARALLADRDVLILDDALSAVDSSTEQEIIENLKSLKKPKIVFIVTHRFKILNSVDTVVVIKDGEVIEKGKPQELLQNKGYFWDMYETAKLSD